jgi:ribosomal protein L31
MNAFILISCFLFTVKNGAENSRLAGIASAQHIEKKGNPAAELSILFPKNNQKVRGEYKISGKAKPGSVVQLHISSTYFKTARDSRQKVSKGTGPINRMNRKFSITADRSGNWLLKKIELLNAGWEETFTIEATSDKRTVSIRVYDNTHPMAID